MRNIILAITLILLIPFSVLAQSRAMKNLSDKHEDAFVLMFYHSTLKMLIPEDNEEFRDIIYGIEKIKVMRVDEFEDSRAEQDEVLADLQEDGFEEAITMRHDGTDMIVFIKERKGITKGAFFLMESDSTLTAVDLVGEIPIDKLFTLSNEIDMLTEARENILFEN
jgi:hypothetical protein